MSYCEGVESTNETHSMQMEGKRCDDLCVVNVSIRGLLNVVIFRVALLLVRSDRSPAARAYPLLMNPLLQALSMENMTTWKSLCASSHGIAADSTFIVAN